MSAINTVWLVFSLLISIYKCQTQIGDSDKYEKSTGPNNEDIWRSKSDIIPSQSTTYGTIRLGMVMSMEFDFIWWGRVDTVNPNYEQFFRVGFDGKISRGCSGEGSRYPSFWMANLDNMHVSVSSGQSCQTGHSLYDYGNINIGTTYHIKIAFNNTQIVVNVTGGGNADWSKVWNDRQATQPQFIGQEADIWFMSNKYDNEYIAANGTFSNIEIISDVWTNSPTPSPTDNPTPTPTAAPTDIPTDTPTRIPTADTPQPTLTPSISPSTSNPTLLPSFQPTMTPLPEGGIRGEPTVSPVIGGGVGSGQNGDNSSSAMDTRTIGIITATMAIFCCIMCGLFIICKKKKKRRHKSSETPSGFPKDILDLKTIQTHSNQRQNIDDYDDHNGRNKRIDINNAILPSHNQQDLEGDGLDDVHTPFTPDGVIKSKHAQYLSEAQRNELGATPNGLETAGRDDSDEFDEEFDDQNAAYLSQAQRDELRKRKQKQTPKYSDTAGSDEQLVNGQNDKFVVMKRNGDSDDEVVVEMQTAGYIGDDVGLYDDPNDHKNNNMQIPALPPSKKNTLSVADANNVHNDMYHDDDDDDMMRDERMETIGAEDDIYDNPNDNNPDNDDYDDYDEYDEYDEMHETIQ